MCRAWFKGSCLKIPLFCWKFPFFAIMIPFLGCTRLAALPVDDSELQIKGYNMLLSSKSHRGVVLYCKKNLQCRQVNFQDNDFVESVWCEIVAGPEHILFGCLYRSPNSTDLNNAALLKLMWEVDKSPYTNLFMVGDFNLPNINWEIPSVAGSGSSFASDF